MSDYISNEDFIRAIATPNVQRELLAGVICDLLLEIHVLKNFIAHIKMSPDVGTLRCTIDSYRPTSYLTSSSSLLESMKRISSELKFGLGVPLERESERL